MRVDEVGKEIRAIELKRVAETQLRADGVSDEAFNNKVYGFYQKGYHAGKHVTRPRMQKCIQLLTDDQALMVAFWCASFFNVTDMLAGLCLDYAVKGKSTEGHNNETNMCKIIDAEISQQRKNIEASIPKEMWQKVSDTAVTITAACRRQ